MFLEGKCCLVTNCLGVEYSFIIISYQLGCSCSRPSEHTPRNLEVMGLNPARCLALFFFFFQSVPTLLHQWNVLNPVPQGSVSLTECCERNFKNGCLAVPPGMKQAE